MPYYYTIWKELLSRVPVYQHTCLLGLRHARSLITDHYTRLNWVNSNRVITRANNLTQCSPFRKEIFHYSHTKHRLSNVKPQPSISPNFATTSENWWSLSLTFHSIHDSPSTISTLFLKLNNLISRRSNIFSDEKTAADSVVDHTPRLSPLQYKQFASTQKQNGPPDERGEPTASYRCTD